MNGEPISDLFDDILCGADLDLVMLRILALPPHQRQALLEALRHVEPEADACAGLGETIRTIVDRFNTDWEYTKVRYVFRFL